MSELIRFYFDQHIPFAVAQGLREHGVDVLTAQEAAYCGSSDEEQLAFAADNRRVLVTFDDDFLKLAASGIQHMGIAFCSASKYSIGELIRVLLLLRGVLETDQMKNHIEFL